MTATQLILLLYVLPMIVSGLLHYLDPKTRTLGDFFGNLGFMMFIPLANIAFMIVVITARDYPKPNWLQRIKDIKIKSVIIFFCCFLVFSCGNSENIEISKKEDRELTLGGKESNIITGSDNHDYYSQVVGTGDTQQIIFIYTT